MHRPPLLRRGIPMHFPSLRRVPWGRFPGIIGTMSGSDSSPPIPRPSVALGFWYLRPELLSLHGAPPGGSSPQPGFSSRMPLAFLCEGDEEVSQVPGQPLCACPVLRPRQDPRTQPLGPRVSLSVLLTTSAPALALSWLNSAAHTLPVYASPSGRPARCNTRFWLVVSLASGDFHPRAAKKLRCLCHLPLLQALPGALAISPEPG